MTSEQAQRIYDETGSIERAAERLGLSRNLAYAYLKRHGVKFRHRGGMRWTEATIERHRHLRELKLGLRLSGGYTPRVTRVECERERRPCVIHDLPDACHVCSQPYSVAGLRSLLEAEGIRR